MEIEEYTNALKVTCYYNPKSIRYIGYTLNKFKVWCKERGYKEITCDVLLNWYSQTKKEYTNPRTVRGYLWHMISYIDWLVAKRGIENNPLRLINPVKASARGGNFLSKGEVELLLKAPDKGKKVKDFMKLLLLYGAGLRLTEMLRIRWEDIDLARGRLKVHKSKNNRSRVVPLPEKVIGYLIEYKIQGTGQGLIFAGRKGLASSVAVQAMVKRYAKKAGIKMNVTPTTLRHSYASHLASSGVSLVRLVELLGHSSISESSIYIHVGAIELKESIKMHPVMEILRRQRDVQ